MSGTTTTTRRMEIIRPSLGCNALRWISYVVTETIIIHFLRRAHILSLRLLSRIHPIFFQFLITALFNVEQYYSIRVLDSVQQILDKENIVQPAHETAHVHEHTFTATTQHTSYTVTIILSKLVVVFLQKL